MTRSLIFLVAAAGLTVPAWAGVGSHDTFARAIIAFITVGLVAGMMELANRARAVDALFAELPLLDDVHGDVRARLADASPLFERLVRARMTGNAAQVGTAVFAPYLVTAVVLIGLLGTFLGMVESLSGARDALSITRDVDELRASLIAPMRGLSRAFSTSVAGVWASAALGLASVILRRTEGRFSRELTAHLSGTLAEQTLAGRQLQALDRIGDQGDALPHAVAGLREITTELPALQRVLKSNSAALSKAATDAIESAAEDVSKALKQGVLAATTENQKAVAQVVSEANTLLGGHLSMWAEALQKDARVRREEEAARSQRLLDGFETVMARFDTLLNAKAEVFGSHLQQAAEALVAAQESRAKADHQAARAFQERLEQSEQSEHQRGKVLQEVVSSCSALLERTAHAQAEQSEHMRAQAQDQQHAASEQREQNAKFLADLASQAQQALEAVQRTVGAQLTQTVEAVASVAKVQLDQAGEAHLAATNALQEDTSTLIHAREQAELDALERIEALEKRLADDRSDQQEQWRAAQDALLGAQRASEKQAAETLDAFAQALQGRAEQTVSLAVDAVEAVAASGAELSVTAERFSDAVEVFRAANETWLASNTEDLDDTDAEVDQEERVGAYADQAREIFDQNLALQRALFDEIQALKGGVARATP